MVGERPYVDLMSSEEVAAVERGKVEDPALWERVQREGQQSRSRIAAAVEAREQVAAIVEEAAGGALKGFCIGYTTADYPVIEQDDGQRFTLVTEKYVDVAVGDRVHTFPDPTDGELVVTVLSNRSSAAT